MIVDTSQLNVKKVNKMSCKSTRNGMKEFIIENTDMYFEAKSQAFLQHVIDSTESYMSETEEELWSVLDLGESILGDDFSFPTENDYLSEKYENQLADCSDQYNDMKKEEGWND